MKTFPSPSRRFVRASSAPARLALGLALLAPLCAAKPERPPAVAIPDEKPAAAYAAAAATLTAATGEDRVAWRGWPLRVFVYGEDPNAAPSDLTITAAEGNKPLTVPPRSPAVWWLSAEQTAGLAPGRHTLATRGLTATIQVAPPPEKLSPAQDGERRFALVAYALDRGDRAEARREAEAWVAADPQDAQPHAVLGDVLAALGDHRAAYAAYEAALALTRGDHPDLAVRRKASASLARLVAQLPTLPDKSPAPAPPPAPTSSSGTNALQWAVSARASSEYRATDYGAAQATGAPNVPRHGDHRNSWASKGADDGEEWLELTFATPVHASEVHVVQNFNPGALRRIDVIDQADQATAVWQGPDPIAYAKNQIGTFVARFPRTANPVARVRLTLDTKAVAGWNEIDAVALVSSPD